LGLHFLSVGTLLLMKGCRGLVLAFIYFWCCKI